MRQGKKVRGRGRGNAIRRGKPLRQRIVNPLDELAEEFSSLSIRSVPREFKITDDNIESFKGMNPNPTDCVINAMEILGLIDSTSAGIARIIVRDMGVITTRISEIFEFITKIKHNWVTYRDKESFSSIVGSLSPGHAFFILAEFYGSDMSHAIVIAKNLSGEVFVLDPQISLSRPDIPRYGPFLYPLENYPVDTPSQPLKSVKILSMLLN